jgi:hypothetical protein
LRSSSRVLGWLLLWAVTRAFVLWQLQGPHGWVSGDVAYFDASLSRLAEQGPATVLVEYPLPGVALVALPWLLTGAGGNPEAYADMVVAFALVTDIAFGLLLARLAGPTGRRTALLAWLAAVPLLGATAYARFDLVPGILAGAGLLLLGRAPRLAAGAAATATGLKLWPALMLPALAAPTRARRGVLLVVVSVGALLAGVSVGLAGWARLVSPLSWQADRGLQIEAVLATPAMVGWALAPERFSVAYGPFNAFEVTGPGVGLLTAASGLLSVLLVPALGLLWARAWRRGEALGVDDVAWLVLAAVAAFMVTSKVLSPQYLLWLLPAAAAALAVVGPQRRLRRWTVVLLVATGLTQLVFPVWYAGVVAPQPWSPWVVLVLAVRNLLLVWLLVDAVTEVLRRQRGIALDRQPPGPGG